MAELEGGRPESKRVLCGVLAIIIGWTGIHKFMLGYTVPGVIHLVLACTGISSLIGLVEGIIYLTKTDDDFVQTYQIGKKEWF